MKSAKSLILDEISDVVARFVYYDRKDDEEIPRGAIEKAISNGQITRRTIIRHFSNELDNWLADQKVTNQRK